MSCRNSYNTQPDPVLYSLCSVQPQPQPHESREPPAKDFLSVEQVATDVAVAVAVLNSPATLRMSRYETGYSDSDNDNQPVDRWRRCGSASTREITSSWVGCGKVLPQPRDQN